MHRWVEDAVFSSVKRSEIVRVAVDTLKNVDLAMSWPVAQAGGPERRPCATGAAWYVLEVGNEQTSVVRLLTLEADRGASRALCCERGGEINS